MIAGSDHYKQIWHTVFILFYPPHTHTQAEIFRLEMIFAYFGVMRIKKFEHETKKKVCLLDYIFFS